MVPLGFERPQIASVSDNTAGKERYFQEHDEREHFRGMLISKIQKIPLNSEITPEYRAPVLPSCLKTMLTSRNHSKPARNGCKKFFTSIMSGYSGGNRQGKSNLQSEKEHDRVSL
ncbi:MAG: hypothetical protein EU981_01670 [Candidatus Liberibacter ctenarytainae]|uniref:Uncharacterized protein n=1 Tax=Candidatus Liberibacter ctenarytainae TaxID=2020335 RepID=A0A937AEU7_9HYPH|nr:hypothetical protein [Candidatus Liberibacter ctenarytainae]